MKKVKQLLNHVNGEWQRSKANEYLDVLNPATAETLAKAPLSTVAEVDQAVTHAAKAFVEWRRTPPTERVQYLFRLKQLLESHFEEIARTVTLECGKTLAESQGELRRGIENVEMACGIPSLMQGYNSEDIARGIDEFMIRQPLGVVAAITPFNFPSMIPLWFMPYAIACGNTYLVKPSEKVPLTMKMIFEMLEAVELPRGVVNLVNGTNEAVNAILDHPIISAISFVGSTAVAKYVYAKATANGKRAQVQGGAKNPIIVLPDADLESATRIVADSAFGSAGQRCLAASIAVTVGGDQNKFTDAILQAASERIVGYGLEEGVNMGPVITPESKNRIEELITLGEAEGANILIDGRKPSIPGFENGNFIGPTILGNVPADGELFKTEIFGPVLSLIDVETIDDAIALVNSGDFGNMASLFTTNGAAARKFRYEAQAGNIGINIGVAAPMAFFPFSGWRQSFFGVMHGQGRDAVEFYTQKKVVIERWPKEWERKF